MLRTSRPPPLRGGGIRSRLGLKSAIYGSENAIDVPVYLVITETQNNETIFQKMRVPHAVFRALTIKPVLVAIGFHDHAFFQTSEIGNVAIARNLPAKMKPALAPAA